MDEAEKYQQRLQAIAEKRRLQEEQDRAKRALEDEKIRLQQQKRKSLRDQWLMEGPPTSPDSAGPRSPLWGSKAQQIEAHIEKLQSETERLGEAVERLQDQIENSSDSTQSHAGHHSNTEGDTAATAGHSVVNDIPEETAVTPNAPSLTNGTMEEEKPHSAPVQDGLVHANGLTEGPVTLTFLGFSEAEPGQGVSDDDSTIIRAERVIITDEGEVIPEASTEEETPAKEPGENVEPAEEEAETQGVENHLEGSAEDDDHTAHAAVTEGEEKTTENNTDANEETTSDANGDTSADAKGDTSADANGDTSANANGDTSADANGDTRADANRDTSANANGDTSTDAYGDIKADANADSSEEAIAVSNTDINGDTSADTTSEKSTENPHLDSCADTSAEITTPLVEESAAEGVVEQEVLEEPTSSEPQLHRETVEGTVEAPAQSSAAPNTETIQQEVLNPAVSFSNSETPAPSSPGQFQDVPLDGAAEESSRKQLADGQLVEEQPLLASKASPLTDAASPNRAEDAVAPKRKTCQCCSLM
ncbi:paralemmin-3 [Colossoma macropomum]|uniref:paralemmin-3 n=1 Tax=Colossoma macropomum TaxID=42526 RepID=UPI0018644AA4|nr:paralemmin-3 [Colossoma macropomum]XP_036426517.1 paralemmin-3 [Colossoma macropomum]